MSTKKASTNAVGMAVTVAAMLISVAVMVVLALADVASLQKLRASRILGTIVPASGELLGQSAFDGSEWAAPESMSQGGLLFGVAEPGKPGDIEFWLDIASRTRAVMPGIQFVGFCTVNSTCVQPGVDGPLTILKSMDPAQVHALTIAAKQQRAFLFRGPRVLSTLPVPINWADRDEFAKRITALFLRQDKETGA